MKENNNKIQIQNGKYLPLLSNTDFAEAEAIFFMGNFDGQFFDSTLDNEYIYSLDPKKIEVSVTMLRRIQNPNLYTAFWLDSDVTLKFKRFIYSCFLENRTPTKIVKKHSHIVEAYKIDNEDSTNIKVTVLKSNAGTVLDVRMPNIIFIGDYNEANFSWQNLGHYTEIFFNRDPYLSKLTENQLKYKYGTKNKVEIVIKKSIENIFTKLSYNIKKKFGGKKMNFDKVIMNPPYGGNLHLKILEKVLSTCGFEDGCEVVNLSPVRWIQDPLAEYKQGSDRKLFQSTIIDKLADLTVISCAKADSAFGIHSGVDLGIYTFTKKNNNYVFESLSKVEKNIFDKVIKNYCKSNIKNNIAYYQEKNKIDGIRIKCVTILHGAPRTSSRSDAANIYYLTDEPLIDGKNKDGKFFTELTSQSKTKNTLPVSIQFNSVLEAQNYLDSLKTNFIKNLVRLVVWDVHVPNTAIPWMYDYTHTWTDADFCAYFNLTPEEATYMKRA